MPPLPPVVAVKMDVGFTVSGSAREVHNIFHLGYSGGPPSNATLATLLGLLDPLIDAYLTTFMHTAATHASTELIDLSSSTGAVETSAPGTAGGNVGTLAPLSVAAVTSWIVSRRYRGGHPRTYMGALSDSQLNPPQLLNGTFETNWQTAANVFMAGVNALVGTLPGCTLGAVSYRTANAPRVTPIFEPFIFGRVHSRIDSQRRRLGKET